MIPVLLDLNILLDFLNHRQFHAEAAAILDQGGSRVEIHVSAHEMTTLAYFLEKEGQPSNDYKQVLSILFSLVKVLPVDQRILEQALTSKVEDYEDAVLEGVCLRHGLEYIVTRNVKDFRHSRIEAVNPAVLLELLRRKGA